MKKKSSPIKLVKLRVRRNILEFYEDDENTHITPGKKDCITRNRLKKQKRYLKDSIKNLHTKYIESGFPPVSYTTFTRLKPFWVLKPKINARDTCLCAKHANMELLMTCLKSNKIIKENSITDVLKALCCNKDNIQCLQRTCIACIKNNLNYQEFNNEHNIVYWKWENQSKTYSNKNGVDKSTKAIQKVTHTEKPLDVIKQFEKTIGPFIKHCGNIKNQYITTKDIKANLSKEECLVYIDFSENSGTKYNSEVQASHWHKNQITMHTAMIYYKEIAQAFCSVSTSLCHDAIAVWAHLVPILQEIKKNAPQITTLHILSDSPATQYRNKKIFYIISQLNLDCEQLRHVIWHYSECGHGKGAPDGVGGVLKRTADQLVAFGRDIVDIETLVESLKTEVPGVKMVTVEEFEIKEKGWILPGQLKTFSGTMNVHQALWSKATKHQIALRSLSCGEPECVNSAVECVHGKHLGFYDLSNVVSNDSQLVPPIFSQCPAMDHNNRDTRSHAITIQRFRGSDKFNLRPKQSSSRRSLKDILEKRNRTDTDSLSVTLVENYGLTEENSDAVPSGSFFEKINPNDYSQFEKTIDSLKKRI